MEKYFSFCLKPQHPEFDPLYISAMFLDPYFSQMLTEQEEELAVNFLKTRASLSDDGSSGTSSTISSRTTAAEPVPTDNESQEGGPSPPKRLGLFKFVKLPGRQPGLPEIDSFSTRFANDIQTVRNLFRPLR
jgi:hypothetical protein